MTLGRYLALAAMMITGAVLPAAPALAEAGAALPGGASSLRETY